MATAKKTTAKKAVASKKVTAAPQVVPAPQGGRRRNEPQRLADLKAPSSKVVQAAQEVALFFNMKELDKDQRGKLIDFAQGLGLVVNNIRDGGPAQAPMGTKRAAKKAAPAKKKPGT
jgi:hypothetical protein